MSAYEVILTAFLWAVTFAGCFLFPSKNSVEAIPKRLVFSILLVTALLWLGGNPPKVAGLTYLLFAGLMFYFFHVERKNDK